MKRTALGNATFFIVLGTGLSYSQVYAGNSLQTDWTFFIEMQAKNDLDPYSALNVQDLAYVGSNEKVTIIVQWHRPNTPGVFRYKINKNNAELIYQDPKGNPGDCVKSFVDGATWAFTHYPSTHKAVIFWGHGSGIEDPNVWWSNVLRAKYFSTLFNAQKVMPLEAPVESNRGILFNWDDKTYMNNQQMIQVLTALKPCNIDVIGMDACSMGHLEVAYQLRKYAKYLVTSQEVVPAYGWFYSDIMKQLSMHALSPAELAQYIVGSYERYYTDKVSWYTQAAIDLSKVDLLKQNIDHVALELLACKQKYGHTLTTIVNSARKASLQFRNPRSIDLHSFYTELYIGLDRFLLNQGGRSEETTEENSTVQSSEEAKPSRRARVYYPEGRTPVCVAAPAIAGGSHIQDLTHLKENVRIGMHLIEAVVLANAAGNGVLKARGISIYYPNSGYIDPSYLKTEFAQESSWLYLLKALL